MTAVEVAAGLGGVVVGALWTSGGPGALQRRTIQHELELADRLQNPELRDRMVRRAEGRAAIYLARSLPSDDSTRTMVMTVVPILVGMAIIYGADLIAPPPVVQAGANLAALLLLGAGFGAMADAVVRDIRAGLTAARVRQAGRRLLAIPLPEEKQRPQDSPPQAPPPAPRRPAFCRDNDLPSPS